MNDTDAQTKGRSPDEVSPVATALKEARAVMTNISEIHAPEDSRFPCQEDIFAWIPCWVRSQGSCQTRTPICPRALMEVLLSSNDIGPTSF